MSLAHPHPSFRAKAQSAADPEPSRRKRLDPLSSAFRPPTAPIERPHPEPVEGRGPAHPAHNLLPRTGEVAKGRRGTARTELPNQPPSCPTPRGGGTRTAKPHAAHSREGGDPSLHPEAGFSLIETLVALAALSLLAGAGMMMTDVAVSSGNTIAERDADATDLLRLRAALKADLSQAAPRRARDESGRKPQTAMPGASNLTSNAFLALTRRGWENHTGEARASLQYVEYAFENGAILRRHRRHIDGADTETPQTLITGVRDVDVAYMQYDQWLSDWAGSAAIPLPDAVRLDITFDDGAELSQLFLLPEGAR